MKKWRWSWLSLIVFGIAISPALAVEAVDQTCETTTKFELTPNTGAVSLVNPDNPQTIAATDDLPINNSLVPSASGLTLAYITSTLDFGQQTVSIVDDNHYSPSLPQSALWHDKFVIEIADGRGTQVGWQLNISGAPFQTTNSDENGNHLIANNVTLSIPAGIVKSSSEKSASISSKNVEVPLDGTSTSKPLLTAPKGTGMGMTTVQIDPNQIKLNIPANSVKPGAYQTGLNWTLAAVPQN